jgi:hypothetical protein
MAIGDDFSIDYTNKIISHSGGTDVSSSQALYSYLQDTFDEQSQMDDTVPMSAQTPTAFTLINGWFMPEKSTRFLNGGSIQTDGWANEIYVAIGGETTTFEGSDIGKQITGSTSGYVGTLLDFGIDNWNKNFKAYIRASSSNDIFDNASEILEVSGGVGQLTTIAAAGTGETVYTNIYTLGSVTSPTFLYILQSGSIIDGYADAWWGEGFIDILIKTQESGIYIDDLFLNVFAREYGNAYDNFRIQTATGRNAVPLATSIDGFNTTATESMWQYTSSITITFYSESQLFDLDNGSGFRPYKCVLDCGGVDLSNVYEYTKWLTERYSRFDIGLPDTGSVTVLTPTNYKTGSIYQSVSESIHNVSIFTPNKQAPFGSYTGKFFAARSVYLTNLAAGDVKNYSLIDDEGVTQDPPNTVSVAVTSVSASDRVAVFRLIEAGGAINKNEYQTLASAGSPNTSGSLTLAVSGGIATDVPKTSKIRISDDAYSFSTWTNGGTGAAVSGVFFLTASVDNPDPSQGGGYGLTQAYQDGSGSYVPLIDILATSTTVSNTLVQVSTIPVLIRVRNGTIDHGILPFEVESSVLTTGMSVAAIRTSDPINTSS